MTKVLVVTKNAELGGRIARAFGELDANVFCIDNERSAEAFARSFEPELVVLDGGMSQAVLRQLATAMRPHYELVLLAGIGQDSVTFPGLTVLTPPFDEGRLKAAVRRKLRTSLPPPVFSVIEYVQLACMSRRSVLVACSNTRVSGHIAIVDGEVWEACAKDSMGGSHLDGEEAFRYWVTQEWLWVRVTPPRQTPVERTVFAHWEHLLLESMQLKDEERGEPAVDWPPPSNQLDVSESPIAIGMGSAEQRGTNRPTAPPPSSLGYPERARTLVNQAIRAITSGDYLAAEKAFEGALALAPEDKLVEYRLRKIREFLQQDVSR